LMVNHGIRRQGRGCRDCHAPDGVMPFEELGYTPQQARALRAVPEAAAPSNRPARPAVERPH
jgi:hypothetical protein